MANYLITGTSRGIGLELVKQLLHLPTTQVNKIFAVTRTPYPAIEQLATSDRVVNVVTDLSDPTSLQAAAAEVEAKLNGSGLDVLVNNAAVLPLHRGSVDTVPAEHLTEAFNINVVGVHLVTGAFLPLLRKEEGGLRRVINITSTMGSVKWSYAWGSVGLAYRTSKSALHMLNALYAHEYKDEGFTFLLISPGWLKTDLGSQYADLECGVGVEAVVRLIQNANPSQNGKFQNIDIPGYHVQEGPKAYIGQEVPW